MTNKNVIIAAFACAAVFLSVSSCVKVETDRAAVPAETISYQVVNCKLKSPEIETRATQPFADDAKFISTAYILPAGQSWDGKGADGILYRNSADVFIDAAEISKVDAGAGTAVWKDPLNSYYWPKNGGSLTFFAYTPSGLQKASGTGNGVSITTSGVSYKGWTADGDYLKTDFMAAVPAKDKTANETGVYYNEGVPMLFKHKLALVQFVAFVEKDDADDIYVESLSITNIYEKGDFAQNNTDEGAWRNRSNPKEYVLYKPDAPEKLSTAELKCMPSGYESLLMVPQNLSALAADDSEVGVKRAAPEIKITYYKGTTDASDRKTASIKFEDIRSYRWTMGTAIKYSISFGDTGYPILFDPSVNPWGDNQGADIVVGGGGLTKP